MLPDLLLKLTRHEDLTAEEAAAAMDLVMTGQATPAQLAALLVGLSMKGERPQEIVGLARTMRSHSVKLSRPFPDAFDTRHRRDRAGTINVSSAAALSWRRAACGWPSTAIARCRAAAAAPTCSRRWRDDRPGPRWSSGAWTRRIAFVRAASTRR